MSDERFEELMNWDKLSLVVLILKIEEENARLRELAIEAHPELLRNEEWVDRLNEILERGE